MVWDIEAVAEKFPGGKKVMVPLGIGVAILGLVAMLRNKSAAPVTDENGTSEGAALSAVNANVAAAQTQTVNQIGGLLQQYDAANAEQMEGLAAAIGTGMTGINEVLNTGLTNQTSALNNLGSTFANSVSQQNAALNSIGNQIGGVASGFGVINTTLIDLGKADEKQAIKLNDTLTTNTSNITSVLTDKLTPINTTLTDIAAGLEGVAPKPPDPYKGNTEVTPPPSDTEIFEPSFPHAPKNPEGLSAIPGAKSGEVSGIITNGAGTVTGVVIDGKTIIGGF